MFLYYFDIFTLQKCKGFQNKRAQTLIIQIVTLYDNSKNKLKSK